MARLSTIGVLPAELVAHVLAEVAAKGGSTADLKRCALVSRSWGHAAQIELFRRVNFTAHRDARLAFVRLVYLSTKPHLAAHVQVLNYTVYSGEPSHDLWWIAKIFISVQTVKIFSMQIHKVQRFPRFLLCFPALNHLDVFYIVDPSERDPHPWKAIAVRALNLATGKHITHALLNTFSQPKMASRLMLLSVRVSEQGALANMFTFLPRFPVLRSLHIIMQARYLSRITSASVCECCN
jgi:hypothetical protein